MAALHDNASPRFCHELVVRRQVRCCVLQLFFSSIFLISWCSFVWLRSGISKLLFAFFSLHTWLGLLLFWTSGLLFVVAELLVVEPQYTPWPTVTDLWDAIRTGGGTFSNSKKDAASGASLLRVKALFRRAVFFPLVVFSGGLGLLSYLYILGFPIFTSTSPSTSHVNVRESIGMATVISLLYAAQQIYRTEWMLTFPIIQRVFWFRLKSAFNDAACLSIVVNIITSICVETVLLIICLLTGFLSGLCTVNQVVIFFTGGALLIFCWESGKQIIQVVFTERQAFVSAPGPKAGENSSALLLSALDFSAHKTRLVEYLAFLDLCCMSEQNVDCWRRAALFEETGETYKRVIKSSLVRIDALTKRIERYMDHGQKGAEQRQGGTGTAFAQVFDDAQLNFWSIRISASLTAISRKEDLYGVAQLSGCNSRVLYSLISCLLAVEAAIGGTRGRLISATYGSTLHWSKLAGVDIGMGVKGSGTVRPVTMYEQAYATADVLRSGIYAVVYAFNEELAPLQNGGALAQASVGNDWLNVGKPLYGTKGMHIDKLKSFLDCQA